MDEEVAVKIVIVGRGRVGKALAQGLHAAGADCQLTSGRQPAGTEIAGAEVVILAVSDAAIHQCAQDLLAYLKRGASVLHCAGARGPDELAACRGAGAHVGVMHPLVSLADPEHSPTFRGATFMVAGDAAAIEAARTIAAALDASAIVMPVHGPAYHALIAMVANGTVALVNAAAPALERLGLGRREAERAIAALLKTVAENVDRLGVPQALTGPIARGDAATIAAHRKALRRAAPVAAIAYDAVAPLVLRCAIDAGLPAERAAEIQNALDSKS